jgi:imidazolonepropionase-like amidohydrolase
MWHPLGEAAAARDAVNARATEGARVVVSGPPVYPTPTGEPVTNDFLWIAVDSTTAERGATLLAAFGAGHLKMRYVQSWSGAPRLIEAAHRHGLSVSGHCAHGLAVVAAGIDGQEHLDGQCGDWEFGVRDDIVQLYRAAGVAVTPVIDFHDETVRSARDTSRTHTPDVEPFVTPALRLDALRSLPPAAQLRIEGRARRARETTRRMFEGGVRIGLGSDAHMYPGGVARELEALVAAGLTPRDALRAATVDAATIAGADQVGRIAPGLLADLVLLDGDPLQDIGNVRKIWQVIQGGWIVDRERLRTREEPGQPASR